MNLVVDIGSTSAKAAIFFNGELINQFKEIDDEGLAHLRNVLTMKHCLVSSLGRSEEEIASFLSDFIYLNSDTPVPFTNKYKTPKTLGSDRLALAAAAKGMYPNQNVLVIDAGTCITYELINKAGEYLGGAISPGMNMRLKSMHEFTKTLPLIEDYYSQAVELIGNTTETSMLSGTVNGTISELKATIDAYKEKYPDLITVICGGDANLFESMSKEGIFVNPNFLFFGLNIILEHNVA